MLSCKQFVEQTSQIIDNEALSIGQKINNKIHMFICIHCRNYLKQAQLASATAKNLELEGAPDNIVDDSVSEMVDFSENNP